MEIEQLKKKIKKIKKAKIRFDEKFRRNYKNELQKFDDEIYSINLLIQSKVIQIFVHLVCLVATIVLCFI